MWCLTWAPSLFSLTACSFKNLGIHEECDILLEHASVHLLAPNLLGKRRKTTGLRVIDCFPLRKYRAYILFSWCHGDPISWGCAWNILFSSPLKTGRLPRLSYTMESTEICISLVFTAGKQTLQAPRAAVLEESHCCWKSTQEFGNTSWLIL